MVQPSCGSVQAMLRRRSFLVGLAAAFAPAIPSFGSLGNSEGERKRPPLQRPPLQPRAPQRSELEPQYVLFVHPVMYAEMKQLYKRENPLFNGEIGSYESIRIIRA